MLESEVKVPIKSSKINNSKEELIEESKQKINIDLKHTINQKINSIRIDEKENIPENISTNNSNIFRGNKRKKEKKDKKNIELNSELSKDSSLKKIILEKDKKVFKYEISNEINKKLITKIEDWDGYNYIRWKGNLILGPCSFRPTMLSLTAISVPIFLFLIFIADFITKNISFIIPLIIFILY